MLEQLREPLAGLRVVAPRARHAIVGTVVESARVDPTEFSTVLTVEVPGVNGRVDSATWIEGRPVGVDPGLSTMSPNAIRRAAGVRAIPSFRAILSGSSLAVDGETVVLDGVTAVPWSSDYFSLTIGSPAEWPYIRSPSDVCSAGVSSWCCPDT